MVDHVKAVTDLVDGVLSDPGQHSPESDQYSDVAPGMPADGMCWRCEAPAAEDSTSGLCEGCRAFLLEDSDVDPAVPEPAVPGPNTDWLSDIIQHVTRMDSIAISRAQADGRAPLGLLQAFLAELAVERFEPIAEPRDLDITVSDREYQLLVTSTSCPEQYTILRDGEQVGYLRLRSGRFRVDCPNCGDTTIGYVEYFNHGWIGAFDPADRPLYLTAAVYAIDWWDHPW